jgi:hypothetical protein
VDGAYLGERKFWPLWKVIRALDIAAFLHPERRRDLWYHKFALELARPIDRGSQGNSVDDL